MTLIKSIQQNISRTYAKVGFEWSGMSAYLVSAGLLSSLFINFARRMSEGVFMKWPKFNNHDKHSLTRALVLLMVYGTTMYFAVGFFCEKYSTRTLGFSNILLIAISTYMLGLLVDFADEVISGIYCIYRGDKK